MTVVDELRAMARELSVITGQSVEENTAWRGADEIERLRAALSVSRGQWIHSANAEQCMNAMGWKAEWDEIQTGRLIADKHRLKLD